jgi:hypothetical protein
MVKASCKWCKEYFSSIRIANYCSNNCRAKFRYSVKKNEISIYKKTYFELYKQKATYKTNLITKKKQLNEVVCKNCNIVFFSNKSHKKFCSNKCGCSHWRSSNKELIKEYQNNKYKNDITRRISTNIRSRLNKALKKSFKKYSTIKNLGCSAEYLKTYLESKFKKDMSWGNYGQWHIDHIIPLSSFNLLEEQQFKIACHYTNLQPLWAKENLSKGNKIISKDIYAT